MAGLGSLFGSRYTLGELMNVDAGRSYKSTGCSVSLVNTYLTLKEESLSQKIRSLFGGNMIKTCYLILKLEVIGDTGNKHQVLIQVDPDFSTNQMYGNRVKIYCDCNDFKFRSAYTLGRRDSLFLNERVKVALGQALSDAPKRKTSTLCKHAHAALMWVMNNYGYIMNNL